MMNAAEAINVTHSTVRAGRYVVLRKPSCDMLHHPGRRMVTACLLLSHADKKQMQATSSTTPPPKKPATCGINFSAPASNSTTPMIVVAIAITNTYDRVTRMKSVSFVFPVKSERVDKRPIRLNVRKIQTTAAATPPSAPNNNDCHVT